VWGCRLLKVAAGPALSLLRPDELELLIVGIRHLDFTALERAAHYDGGYNPKHPTVRALWGTVQGLSLENKKRFLAFCTGSDR
jgi:ubiquitin-protein ligase E3 A